MDKIDKRILTLLQQDATIPVAEIGKKVGLSTTPCWRRIQKLEEDGVIKKRVALLNAASVNARVTVFVSIRTNAHNAEWLKRFSEIVEEFPEVVEFYRMSGDIDYLMRVVVPEALIDRRAGIGVHRIVCNLTSRDIVVGLIGINDPNLAGVIRSKFQHVQSAAGSVVTAWSDLIIRRAVNRSEWLPRAGHKLHAPLDGGLPLCIGDQIAKMPRS